MRSKNVALKKYRKYKSTHFYESYKRLRTISKNLARKSYNAYLNNIESLVARDPRKFWEFAQDRRGGTRIPGLMKFNNLELNTSDLIVDGFAEYFGSVYVKSDPVIHESISDNLNWCCPVHIATISDGEIFTALKKSKNTFSMGVDNIPSFLLRTVPVSLSSHFP